jgi:putative ATP-dependent endonuclease of the OLD family
MKLKSITIENFRAYKEPRTIYFDDLTTIIGRNDIGKSTILEALEIFFNSKAVTIDKFDSNISSKEDDVSFTLEFEDLPDELTLDAGAPTSLSEEFLLSKDNTLVLKRVYDCSKVKPSEETFIVANHPTAKGVDDLLQLKESELQKRIKDAGLAIPMKGNPGMRSALRSRVTDLKLDEVNIPISKAKEDGKRLWEQIDARLPMFALFQSDRASKDSDGEVQNPLKGAVTSAIAEARSQIEEIEKMVRDKSEEIANLTHAALKDIDPELASSLRPKFTSPTPAKWGSLFSLGMDTNGNIPLNKRGSGVRRLILVSFFKAEAERKLTSLSKANLIYAIEEPETSQHPANQKILIEAFQEIASQDNCQVILTTHSPGLAADLPADSVRFITTEAGVETPVIETGADVFGDVAEALGLTPDSRVKALVCVEGPTDVVALKEMSRILHEENKKLPNLKTDPRFAFISLGGGTLKHWVNENYLKNLGIPEVHIYDADVNTYQDSIDTVNGRADGSWGKLTNKYEIENYLHSDAVEVVYPGVTINIHDQPGVDGKGVDKLFGEAISVLNGYDGVMGSTAAKKRLSKVFEVMTAEQIHERDPQGEVIGWLSDMLALAE